jgi:hypothetical protein
VVAVEEEVAAVADVHILVSVVVVAPIPSRDRVRLPAAAIASHHESAPAVQSARTAAQAEEATERPASRPTANLLLHDYICVHKVQSFFNISTPNHPTEFKNYF